MDSVGRKILIHFIENPLSGLCMQIATKGIENESITIRDPLYAGSL